MAAQQSPGDGPSTSTSSMELGVSAFWTWVAFAAPAAAADEVAYNAGGREEFLQNAAGVAYVMLVAWFLYRVLTKRAKRFREQKLSDAPDPFGMETSLFDQLRERMLTSQPARDATVGDAIIGAVQAGGIAFGLFIFTDKMQTLVENSSLPDQYTARNISITVRTILLGLGWLVTFIFAANSVGLAAMAVQWLIKPESMRDPQSQAAARRAAGPQLPQVSVTASADEIRKAFDSAERMGRAEGSTASASMDTPGPEPGPGAGPQAAAPKEPVASGRE